MKKTLLQTLLLIALASTSQAQTILNGNFSQFVNASANQVTYSSWTGTAYTSNTINGNSDNGTLLKSAVTRTVVPGVCLQYGYDKATGKMFCIDFGNPTVQYSTTFNTLSQSVAITEIPQKISGKFIYSSNVSNLNSAMIIEGNYNGQRFQDTLILNNATQSLTQELSIGTNYLPCVIAGIGGGEGGGIIKRVDGKGDVDNCPVKNTIEIKLVSCLNCPTAATYNDYNSLAVDDLQIVNLATGINDQINDKQFNVYPNPAHDLISVQSFSQIFDLLGNKVAEGTDKIDISSLIKGVYFVKTAKGFEKIIVE
jgi:hypothetical protein